MDTSAVVGVVPDVTGIDRVFDYEVPDALAPLVGIGTRVRVVLNGRRVAGWVVRSGAHEDGRLAALKPLDKVSGIGPDADMVDLCTWASYRWCAGRLRPFLVAASPPTMLGRAAPRHRTRVLAEPSSPAATGLLERGGGVLRLPPSDDQLPAVLSAARLGPTLVVVASADAARVMAARLRRTGLTVASMPDDWAAAAGGVDVVIGARGAAFAPCPDLAAAVVIDEHDESLQEERTPTWHAREVVAERARRKQAPLVLVSPCPTLEAVEGRIVVAPPRERERNGWPEVVVADPGDEPPWKRSLLSSHLIAALRDPATRVVCVLNTKGRARLSACRRCQALARCRECGGSLIENDAGGFDCPVCATKSERLCPECGAATLSRLRPGVARLEEELRAAARRPVLAVTAATDEVDDTGCDIFVGTEAVLHRVRHIDVVAFLDFDGEVLAPRFRAAEQSFALVARAARLVGPRRQGGRILLQTTLLEHAVVRTALDGDPSLLEASERERRRLLSLPPFSALAVLEGDGAESFAAEIAVASNQVAVSRYQEHWLVRAPDHEALSAACAAAERGTKVRVVVDPPRL
ncbi:MAG: hypothetical protein ACKOBT_10260 [Actinomycetota bacterium]